MHARATLRPDLPLELAEHLPAHTAAPRGGPASRTAQGPPLHDPLHSWLAAVCAGAAVLLLFSGEPLVGAVATLILGVGGWVYLFTGLGYGYPGFSTRQFALLAAVSSPVTVEPPLLNSLLARALAFLMPGAVPNTAAALLFAVTALVLLATARPGSARQGDGTLVHGVDYLLPHVGGGLGRSEEPWPEHRLLLDLQEATDRVVEAHHVLGPDSRTAEAVALARREEWAAFVRVNLRHRRGFPRRGAPGWPELSEGDIRRPLRLGLAAHRAVAAHRRWRRLAESGPGTVPAVELWRSRRTSERLEREFLGRAAELGGPGAGLWAPDPSATGLREAVRRPGRARPRSRVVTALAGLVFVGGAALALTWYDAFHLLLVLGWTAVGVLVVWARLRRGEWIPWGEAAAYAVVAAVACVGLLPFLRDVVVYLVWELAPDLFLHPGDVATALLYLAAALTCWGVAALGVGGVGGEGTATAPA
ncbi:threonine/serine exporter family protein [Nocardiopsis deserti]|uniref:threonine/serine exporter family protein n=1 Tax=Nocardiopsis deserti TaxID=2605988 RepID=UPI00123A2D16|nr:threonine/serine exporter family protein [Nocardiopsis deserti]